MAAGIEIPNLEFFLNSYSWEPFAILHEFAHFYHQKFAGISSGNITSAFEHANSQRLYENVPSYSGQTGRAYALTNEREYFAELTEAYFGRNDYFPFTRGELEKYDLDGFKMIQAVWLKPYDEMFRPQFHYTPSRNWMNDPNGLVFANGSFHLFYQYNPEGIDWGNMSWGHAVSSDLFHWSESGTSLNFERSPTNRITQMFWSGSAVLDVKNTSGLTARHHRNVRAWRLGYRSSGSFLGRAIIWHPLRKAIGELEDLAHRRPVFGGSAHHPPPRRGRAGALFRV